MFIYDKYGLNKHINIANWSDLSFVMSKFQF